jgi:hypothetical protein
MVRRVLLSVFMLLGCWPPLLAAAEFTATVDRTQVTADGYVLLTLRLINSDTRLRARGVDPNVDLTLLSDYFTVGVPKTKNRFNLYQGQGRSTSELEVELFPKRQGTLTIPPFTVDTLHTKPIPILVVPAVKDATPDVFIKSGVIKASVWQREQTLVYLDLYYRVDLKKAELGEHIDSDPQDVDLDKLPQGQRKESIGAFTYNVQRIAWAVMPVHSGTLVVTLPELWAETADGEKFHSPQQKQSITVKALPAAVPPQTPVGRPSLTTDLKLHDATVDKLFSWTVTLKAAAPLGTLPDALPVKQLPDQFKFYYDRPDLRKDVRADGMTAIAVYTVSAIPLEAGDFELPAMEIPYFDPDRGIMRSVTQAAVPVTVTAAAEPRTAAPPPASPAPVTETASPTPSAPRAWQIATGVFAALWVITALLLWRRPRTRQSPPAVARPPLPPSTNGPPYKRLLLEAFQRPTLEEGIDEFERCHGTDKTLRETVGKVQRLYYGPHKGDENSSLEQEVKEAVREIRAARSKASDDAPADPWSPRAFTPAWRVTNATSDY